MIYFYALVFYQIGNTLRRCCENVPHCDCISEETDNSPLLLPIPIEQPLQGPPEPEVRTPYWVSHHSQVYSERTEIYHWCWNHVWSWRGVFLCGIVSFFHICVAAVGLSSTGGHPLLGLLHLMGPCLYHPRFQDECKDFECHPALSSWRCLCLCLFTEEGTLSVKVYSMSTIVWSSYANMYCFFSIGVWKPKPCSAATMQ